MPIGLSKHEIERVSKSRDSGILHEISVKRGEDGGFVVEHHHMGNYDHRPIYSLKNHRELKAHFEKHFPEKKANETD